MVSSVRRRGVALLGFLALLGTSPAAGQSFLAGTVRADSSGRPLPGVEVLIEGTALRATTGLHGRYLIEGGPSGRRWVLFRSVGYLPERMEVLLTAGDTTVANAVLVPRAVVLESINVDAKVPRGEGREGFEERRRLGFGKFYDSLELRRSEHLRLDDLLRRQGGVEVRQLPTPEKPWVAFHPNRLCPMQVYYNGSKIGEGGRFAEYLHWFDLKTFSISSLESVEVYRSAAQVPGIYGGPTADCGVILLWGRQ